MPLLREDWYRQLAIANRLIVAARECVVGQKARISALRQEGQSAGSAIALLRLCEETLHEMNDCRSTILDQVRRYRLPIYQERGVIILLKAEPIEARKETDGGKG